MNSQAPGSIAVLKTSYLCRQCGVRFEWRHAADGCLVKFVSHDGALERWLPTYGEGGYLELLGVLVPEWSVKETITKRVADAFERALAEQLTRKGRVVFVIERGKVCPGCGSKELTIEDEIVLTDPKIDWLDLGQEGEAKGSGIVRRAKLGHSRGQA